MKIAYIISTSFCISPYNGIRVQAKTWAEELERQGHHVVRVNPWDRQEWEQFDIIHIIGYTEFLKSLGNVWKRNPRIVFSPIIDSMQNIRLYRMTTHWGCNRLRLTSSNYVIRQASKYIAQWNVRTRFEYRYVHEAYGIGQDKIVHIPLSYRLAPGEYRKDRGDYCFHVSKLTDGRKNVMRLIQAAEKYQFNLKLAGSISSEKDFAPFRAIIDRNPNIEYLGRVSDEQLLSLYQEAKVFALPSVIEGVGLVALEAAACGCNIVVSKNGGPKEYYSDMAMQIDPMSVDSIGQAVVMALKDDSTQPRLRNYILTNYNLGKNVNDLVGKYMMIMSEKKE